MSDPARRSAPVALPTEVRSRPATRPDYRELLSAIQSNGQALKAIDLLAAEHGRARRGWYLVLRRRSQRRLTWTRFRQLLQCFPLPSPSITSPPGPCPTSCSTLGGAECGKAARSDLWGRKPNG